MPEKKEFLDSVPSGKEYDRRAAAISSEDDAPVAGKKAPVRPMQVTLTQPLAPAGPVASAPPPPPVAAPPSNAPFANPPPPAPRRVIAKVPPPVAPPPSAPPVRIVEARPPPVITVERPTTAYQNPNVHPTPLTLALPLEGLPVSVSQALIDTGRAPALTITYRYDKKLLE